MLQLLVYTLATTASAQSIAGIWHATVRNPAGEEVAFRMELKKQGKGWQGAFLNGTGRTTSTSGSFDGKALKLEFDYWDGVLEAQLTQGKWTGSFARRYRKETLRREFYAQRKPIVVAKAKPKANISGDWILDVDDAGKPEVYRAKFQQKGSRAEGTIIPVSGDWGTLTGVIDGNTVTLSHFDGIRALLLKATIGEDGRLIGKLNSTLAVTGRRAGEATSKAPDPMAYTRMKDAEDAFQFDYPDLDGKRVTNSDERFRNKVVIVTITGSWCPNCHEEAPYLNELYERYKSKGLEVVALGFEYTGEVDRDLRQLKRFVAKYGVKYPVLLAGTTENAAEKLAQLDNFSAYPTTIFIGRNGRVKAIHAGFDGPSTGARYTKLKQEMEEIVLTMLSE